MMKSWKKLVGNVGGKIALFWKIRDALARIWEAIQQLLKWVKRILDQLDRIEAKLDRVLECVEVDQSRRPKRRRADPRSAGKEGSDDTHDA